jgi:RimJ/RimL family protein N-acetyltransferase
MSLHGSSELDRLKKVGDQRLPVPIFTERLELRPFRQSDAESIARLLGNPLVTQFIGGTPLSSEDAARAVARMSDAFRTRGWGTLAVVPKGEKDCVGYCGVRPLACTPDVEIAFGLDPRCWNLGYATEAARACIDTAFRHLGLGSIVATVYPDNKSSCRVLNKLGLTQRSEVFGHWPRERALLFRIERGTWEAGMTLTSPGVGP